jgi:hypothetical protein
MWERVSPDTYRNALRRTGRITETERVEYLQHHDDAVRSVLQESAAVCTHSHDVASRYDSVSRVISKLDMSVDDRKVVDATVKRNLYTNYGTAFEHHALAKVRETLGIVARTDDTFYKMHVCDVDGIPLWIGGKIDAITDDRIVIEIKNRIRRLFYKIPFYEIIQLQTYLHLLDVPRGVIVECLTVPGDSIINIVPVRRDKTLWNDTLVPKMQAFVRVFLHLLHTPAFQDEFLQATKKNQDVLVQTKIDEFLRA